MNEELRQRSLLRKNRITINKIEMNDSLAHHSFHFELSPMKSWELLSKISLDHYEKEVGIKSNNRVDKSIVKIIKR
jgi:hypothetical protein